MRQNVFKNAASAFSVLYVGIRDAEPGCSGSWSLRMSERLAAAGHCRPLSP